MPLVIAPPKSPLRVDADPPLDLADVYAVIAYYLRHRAEVDAYLQEREQQAREIRRQIEARFDPTGVRERLLARRQARAEPDDPGSWT
jgi:hypothetical protein